MSIELLMTDMLGDSTAIAILEHCEQIMPPGFFSQVTLCAPQITCPFSHRFIETMFIPCAMEYRQLYSIWKQRELPRLIDADFMLMVQRDGYILNPNIWTNDFLDHDYIGAPWPKIPGWPQRGGNSGFSLISKKLADWLSSHPNPIKSRVQEDVYMSDILADEIGNAGFKIAPREIGAKFSLELDCADFPRTLKDTFGFHGSFHLPNIPQL